MSDNPVPFDFVPFSKDGDKPLLHTVEAWESQGKLFSGYIDYTIRVLTSVHIVGKQNVKADEKDSQIEKSFFLRVNGVPAIPGSTLKGMIRSFFEALTGSWVSQATDEHPHDKKKKRRIPFTAYSPPGNRETRGPVIPEQFRPHITEGSIDLASFLFGIVSDGQGDEDAYQSRLSFEDIYMDRKMLSSVRLPDVQGTAFMGGPKPRINNWWYFKPALIQEHRVRAGGREISLTDFIGKEYWGRKFYFHQDPEKAVAEYKPPAWSVYRYALETIPKDSVLTGRIYFESMPEPLLNLFLIALQPGANIRHKIGYGQAFGLGSIDIRVEKVKGFPSDGLSVLQRPEKYDFKPVVGKGLEHEVCKAYADSEALKWLARILSYDEAFIKKRECVFTYPPFTKTYFKTPVSWDQISAVTKVRGSRLKVSETEAKQIAEKLFAFKKTIHFRVYQEKTDLWKAIAARKP